MIRLCPTSKPASVICNKYFEDILSIYKLCQEINGCKVLKIWLKRVWRIVTLTAQLEEDYYLINNQLYNTFLIKLIKVSELLEKKIIRLYVITFFSLTKLWFEISITCLFEITWYCTWDEVKGVWARI